MRPMKLGIDTYSYHLAIGCYEYHPRKRMTWDEFMSTSKSLGVEGVMIVEFSEEEKKSNEFIRSIRTKADELHLYIETGTDGTDVKRLSRDLRFSQSIGSKIMRITVEFDRYSRNFTVEEQLKAAVLRLREVTPLAEKLDIKLAIENHQDLKSSELVSLLHQVDSDHLGICYDTGNSLAVLEDPIYTAQELAPYSFTTHFKDCCFAMSPYGTNVTHTGLGRGLLPLAQIVDILKQKAHDPNINIEVVSQPAFTEEETLVREHRTVEESAKYARESLGI